MAGSTGAAALLMATGLAVAQAPAPAAPDTQPVAPAGYSLHESVDLGGRIAGISGQRRHVRHYGRPGVRSARARRELRTARSAGHQNHSGRFPQRVQQRLGRRPVQLRQDRFLQGQALRVFRDVPPRSAILRLRSARQPEYSRRVCPHPSGQPARRLARSPGAT